MYVSVCVRVGGFLVEVCVKAKALGCQRQRRPPNNKAFPTRGSDHWRAGIHPIHPTISPSLAHGFGRVGAGGWGVTLQFQSGRPGEFKHSEGKRRGQDDDPMTQS